MENCYKYCKSPFGTLLCCSQIGFIIFFRPLGWESVAISERQWHQVTCLSHLEGICFKWMRQNLSFEALICVYYSEAATRCLKQSILLISLSRFAPARLPAALSDEWCEMGQKLNYSSDELIWREEVEKEKIQSFSTLILPFTAPQI